MIRGRQSSDLTSKVVAACIICIRGMWETTLSIGGQVSMSTTGVADNVTRGLIATALADLNFEFSVFHSRYNLSGIKGSR